MKVTCSNCSAEYPIADQRVPPRGLTIKCPRCTQPIQIPGRPPADPAAQPPPQSPWLQPPVAAPPLPGDRPAGGQLHSPNPAASFVTAPRMQSSPAESFWVKRSSGQEAGPYSEQQIIRLLHARQLSGNELISRDQRGWDPLIEHDPFAEAAARGGLSAQERAPAEPPSSRIARIPYALESGEFPAVTPGMGRKAISVPLDHTLDQSDPDSYEVTRGSRAASPAPGGEKSAFETTTRIVPSWPDALDLPLERESDPEPALPVPAYEQVSPRRWLESEAGVDLIAPFSGLNAALPSPWERPMTEEHSRAILDELAEIDLLAPLSPVASQVDLPQPARPWQTDLPRPAQARQPQPAQQPAKPWDTPPSALPRPPAGEAGRGQPRAFIVGHELEDRTEQFSAPSARRTRSPRAEHELPLPARGLEAELPAPLQRRPTPEDEIDLLAPFGEDTDLPIPMEEERGDWDGRGISLGDHERSPSDISSRLTGWADDLGEPSAGPAAVPQQEIGEEATFVQSPRQTGFRVVGRTAAETVNLDQTRLVTEQLARPELVPEEAPRLGERGPARPPVSAGPLRTVLLSLLILLGVGTAMSFTTWGFFGMDLLLEPPEQIVRRPEAPSAAATSAQPPSRGGEKPGEGKPVGPVEVGPSLLAETVHLTGTPASDAYINYNHSLEEQKKLVFSPKASDKDRCIFALTAGFFTMRYGQNDALAGEARRALDAAGSSDEISECQLAEVSLALAAGKLDDAVEPVEELLRKDPQNSDAMLLKGEMLIQRKQHAAAAQILRQAMMLRSSQPRLTYALARAQLLDGKVLEGRQRMEEVLQLDEDHPLATMAMAEELRSREKYADAVRILRRMTNEDRPLGPNLLLANAHQLTADMLTRQGKSDDAVRELTQALTRKPGNVEILLELGKLYNQRGQYEQALQQYDSINSLGKPNLDAHIGQIRCLLALRKLSEANEVIIAARREWPENPQLPYYQGIVQEERGAIDKAREEYQNALKQDPHFFYPTIRLARLFLREGKKDEALKAMLKAVKENTKAGVLQDGLGELYITLNDLPRARTAFEKALELDPLLHIARFHLASTLLNLGESQAALEQFLKVQASGNDALEVHYGLARTLQALGQFDQAIEEYNAVLALDEDNDEYSFAAGTAYFEKGEYEKARQRFNQALALNSKLHRAHFLTGLAFLREGNAVQAEKRFRIAVEDFRESLEYGFWLAVSLEMQGKSEEARDIYLGLERVIKRTPARIAEIPDLFFRLGRNFLLAGTPSKAVQYLSQSLSPKEKRPENWYMMGEAMYQMNMYEKSIIFFKEALKRKRNYSDAHYKVGMASLLQANPNRQQAIDHLRETIAFDKERQHVDAFKHLGFLYRDAGRSGEAAEMLRSYLRQLAPGAPDRREVLREIEALTSRRAPPPPPPLLNQPGKKKKKASDEEEG